MNWIELIEYDALISMNRTESEISFIRERERIIATTQIMMLS